METLTKKTRNIILGLSLAGFLAGSGTKNYFSNKARDFILDLRNDVRFQKLYIQKYLQNPSPYMIISDELNEKLRILEDYKFYSNRGLDLVNFSLFWAFFGLAKKRKIILPRYK